MAYTLIYLNCLNNFQTKQEVDAIRDVVGGFAYVVQSKQFYSDSTRSSLFKIKYYLEKNEVTQQEFDTLISDVHKILSNTKFVGKRQKKFLRFLECSAQNQDKNFECIFV